MEVDRRAVSGGGKKNRLDVPIGAAEVQALVKDYLAMPAPIKEKLGKVLGGK